MTILLNVEVKPNGRTHLLDADLREQIRKVLERVGGGENNNNNNNTSNWKSSDFPNVSRCILNNLSSDESNNKNNNDDKNQQSQQTDSSSSLFSDRSWVVVVLS